MDIWGILSLSCQQSVNKWTQNQSRSHLDFVFAWHLNAHDFSNRQGTHEVSRIFSWWACNVLPSRYLLRAFLRARFEDNIQDLGDP